ncbi:uncharacterized protein UV8b_07146 [Ustilaginoidea virens]|uniref:Uncharacterized protein n=1 Tax=Ustilaginoidea virens TaxID=1159556 RepID=A0A1B5L5C4_USTVR|nr:uncharacterized protein UV8b_07146 [Ustilaginoidea virens]QUC22905.1 hypothetical protein UV8b_07146 [Ustilaginoidea virens]GAO18720.1 hypothetical protein UVI_02047220 [Ustilaginoidea virens]
MPPSRARAPPRLTRLLAVALLAPLHSPCQPHPSHPPVPVVIHTWGGPFTVAADAAFASLGDAHSSALDAVQAGGAACQLRRCDGTVGYGGSPDENCETTLDAMIMDGATLNVGAVGALRRVRDAVAVARRVLEHTQHSLLVGELATQFALESGFREEDLGTAASRAACQAWRARGCQPNWRVDVAPDPKASCGPYTPLGGRRHGEHDGEDEDEDEDGGRQRQQQQRQPGGPHDTIALVALDAAGNMAAATSTNGKAHKIPGRVGDAPVPGSGCYVDSRVGGCGATGDGDLLMRLLPCYQAVESMRRGMSPAAAADDAVRRMLLRYPLLQAGLVVMNSRGEHAGAASNWRFEYSVRGRDMPETRVVAVTPVTARSGAAEL